MDVCGCCGETSNKVYVNPWDSRDTMSEECILFTLNTYGMENGKLKEEFYFENNVEFWKNFIKERIQK